MLYERQMAWPTDWTAVYQRPAPFVMEIGFGGGNFLIDLAQKRPLANVLGVEISIQSIYRAERKAQTAGLTNLRLLQTDARYLLRALCPLESIDAVTINFPDPWPKAGHQRRRLISTDFLHLLATRMRPDGVLDIATDHADYQTAVTDALQQTPFFDSRLDVPFVTQDDTRLKTKYERTAIREGRTCHYYKWRRNHITPANLYEIPKEHAMPHVVLHLPLPLDAVRAAYQPMQIDTADLHIKLTEPFASELEEKLLIETYINEAPLSQRVGLVVRQRHPGEYVLSLHEIGFPRSTSGTHLALARLAGWLLSLHPETAVASTNLQFEIEPAA